MTLLVTPLAIAAWFFACALFVPVPPRGKEHRDRFRPVFLSGALVIATFAATSPAGAAMATEYPPSQKYCLDTLYGRAGHAHFDNDDEVRWKKRQLEAWAGPIAYTRFDSTYTLETHRRAVKIDFVRSGKGDLTRKFYCDNDYSNPTYGNPFWTYDDYPQGYAESAWYD